MAKNSINRNGRLPAAGPRGIFVNAGGEEVGPLPDFGMDFFTHASEVKGLGKDRPENPSPFRRVGRERCQVGKAGQFGRPRRSAEQERAMLENGARASTLGAADELDIPENDIFRVSIGKA